MLKKIKRNTFALVHYLSICFLWTGLCFHGNAQTIETPPPLSEEGKIGKGKPDESVITVKAEDIEHARKKGEEVKAYVGKAIDEIKSFIRSLEQDAKAMALYRDRLRQEKKYYQNKEVNQKFLELLDREIEVVKEKIDIDNEQIETYEDRIAVLHDQTKVYSDLVVLLTLIAKLEEEISTTPYDTTPMIQKEVDIAKNYIAEIQDGIKEKESVVSFFTNRLKEIRDKTFVDEQNLAQDLKSVKEGIGNDELSGKLQEKIESILLLKKAVNEQWVTIFKTRLETSRIRYDIALQAWKNAELNAAFLAEKARHLEEKQKEGKLKNR
ncbi:MAG: hypothetical protein E3K38_15100 [Candidatus Kuenenia stuttgartiensis]|nr:hypothetical protein [Candidatus Kuenenia stuttgartiensis]